MPDRRFWKAASKQSAIRPLFFNFNLVIQPLGWEMQVNKLLKYGMLAVYIGAGAGVVAHADPQVQLDQRDPNFSFDGVKVTLGGFTELAGIYREHDEEADVGSSYFKAPLPGYSFNYAIASGAANSTTYTVIPPGGSSSCPSTAVVGCVTTSSASTANPQLYYEPEYRESARQSRFAVLAQHGDDENKFEYYLETDFLSAGTTSNSNESNSYTLRMRQFYADWRHDDWYLLAGQAWSLATPYKQGLEPNKQNTPLTIDAQYVVGFNWARQAQLRLVKNFGKFAALGVSLEEPQVAGVAGSASSGDIAVTSATGSGSGLLNPATTYSSDIAPDAVVKFETEPGFGHFEVYSLTRFFHDRGNGANDPNLENHTKIAQSVGASALLPVIPKIVDFQASGLYGRGNGRYGSGQLDDGIINPATGAITPAREQQALVGLVAHPTNRLDLYVYGGLEHEKADYADGGAAASATKGSANSGCDLNPGTSTSNLACDGIIGFERMVAFGAWWKAYQGTLGNFQVGAQGTYLVNHTLEDGSGVAGSTKEPMAFVSFRYYPFQ